MVATTICLELSPKHFPQSVHGFNCRMSSSKVLLDGFIAVFLCYTLQKWKELSAPAPFRIKLVTEKLLQLFCIYTTQYTNCRIMQFNLHVLVSNYTNPRIWCSVNLLCHVRDTKPCWKRKSCEGEFQYHGLAENPTTKIECISRITWLQFMHYCYLIRFSSFVLIILKLWSLMQGSLWTFSDKCSSLTPISCLIFSQSSSKQCGFLTYIYSFSILQKYKPQGFKLYDCWRHSQLNS
jgi:hypothetical protein